MAAVYPALTRASVKDSFDEDDLSDVDDEVFIRDGKNGSLKPDKDGGVKRPLMAPRRKTKTSGLSSRQDQPGNSLLSKVCLRLVVVVLFLSVITFCLMIINSLEFIFNDMRKSQSSNAERGFNVSKVIPCTSLESSILWSRTLPKFTSEAPLRSNDVNGDKVDDIIIGFSTGLDAIDAPEYLCDLYFGGQTPCLGGIMALDGKTGDTIWIHWTAHAIFNVDCGLDVTSDNIKDCLITGRGGIFHAVDGSDGSSIWKLNPPRERVGLSREENVLDVYDATFMNDFDEDSVPDVMATHTIQSGKMRSSEILLVSGKTGNVIRRLDFPNKEELFIAPRALIRSDGETIIILVSSTPKQSGGLYVLSYSDLIHGQLKLNHIYWGKRKGILLPPIFADITLDGTEDIIVATMNSTIIAFDGRSLKPIWNYTIPNSEIISIPIPGYYNDDDVPDFMVKHQIGPGYPVYYYTLSMILDGRNGKPLLEKPLSDSLSGQMSGLSISVEDYGNDWFIYWSSNCLNHEGNQEEYHFLQGQSLLSQSRADLCKLRFNTTLVTRLWALSQHVGPPGQSIYCSEDWKAFEYNNSIDPREEAEKYLRNHPNIEGLDRASDLVVPLVSERSPRIEVQHRKNSGFRQKLNEKNAHESGGYFGKYIAPDTIDDEDDTGTRYDNSPISAENYDLYKNSKNVISNLEGKSRDETWKDPSDWGDDELRGEKQYDMMYADNDNQADPIETSHVEDIREQRSDSTDPEKTVINESEGLPNQYDPNMDYTNGGSKYIKYPPASISLQSGLSIFNNDAPELSRLDNKKKIQKRPGTTELEKIERSGSSFGKSNDNKDYANIEKIFKRESVRNDFATRFKTNAGRNRRGTSRGNEFIINKGIQRQPPTGILLPSIAQSSERTSLDLVFSTYWLPPSEVSLILVQQDLDCIRSKQSKNLEPFDREDIVIECLAERGIDYKLYQEGTSRENVKIPIGQMTIYRIKLECACPYDMLPGQSCKNISQEQSWPAHLGESANGFFRPSKRP